MLAWLGVCALAALIGILISRTVLPQGPANALQRTLERKIDNWRAKRREPDPFASLKVQMQLTRLSAEIAKLENDPNSQFARGFHLHAAILAYERALDEGCRLAGAGTVEGEGAVHRLLAESELRHRGWTW